ncbi:hypothetical protein DPMN_049683 [Dreissena polymorpha]|uniref:Uncharacterized protein n=1 Tax=Dreissena polymorpha TaxID=45954 RepID=A0A9D4CFC5_DREPO|nr:hypothetical protein DPMN_049683 [Dreissena polymorpha]
MVKTHTVVCGIIITRPTVQYILQWVCWINVATRVLTRKNAPPPGGHIFQPTGIIFELIQNIFGMNRLTEFHEDRTINVASRVKNAPALGSHVFSSKHIIETNLLTKFHVDWTLNVASGELKRLMLTPRNAQRTS